MEKLGPEHPLTLIDAHDNLAGAYHDAGRLSDAIPLYEQVRASDQKPWPRPPEHTRRVNNLAAAYQSVGRFRRRSRCLKRSVIDTSSEAWTRPSGYLTPCSTISHRRTKPPAVSRTPSQCSNRFETNVSRKIGVESPEYSHRRWRLLLGELKASRFDVAIVNLRKSPLLIEKRNFQHQYAAAILNQICACHEE